MTMPKTPVRIAVEPLLKEAQDAAVIAANNIVNKVLEELAAHNWDAQACAPWPHGLPYGSPEYHQARSKNTLFNSLTEDAPGPRDYGIGAPNLRVKSEKGIKRFVDDARENATLQYESFICKLEDKIGSHSAAVLDGSHIWGYSILTVTTPEGIQRWKTQTIINVSKLGKLFNQYPTRKVK